jgi:hypothetical protein
MNPALISRTSKERFLAQMSEDHFRDNVVRPILLLKGYKDGRDLCGPTEQGKDAIFYEHDRLGTLELTAIQTKKGSVNLASKAADNLPNIVAQLKTAATTTYPLLTPLRVKVRPSKVYLVASGKINEAARNFCIEQVPETTLRFLDRDDIIPWVDEQLPQLWLDLDANVLTYLQAVERQLAGNDGPFAAQFLPRDKNISASCFTESPVSIYVRRSGESTIADHKAKISLQKQKKDKDAPFPMSALPSKPYKRVLLLGDGGSGKTTGLLQIVYQTARSALEKAEIDYVPVVIKASDIAAKLPSELSLYLEERSRELSLQRKPVFGHQDLLAGRVCAFIDGLDEIANPSSRKQVAELASNFSAKFPKCLIIVTSRPYEFLAEIEALETFERLFLLPLTWKSAEKILDLTRKGKEIESTTIKEAVNRLARTQGFSLTPLMVSIYASTANFDLRDVPPNITELFKRFTEQMLGRWDEQKGLTNLQRPLVKDFALCALAHQMHVEHITSISKDRAEIIIREKLKETGHDDDGKAIFREILDRSNLFRDLGDDVAFRHHMFQEFFAGRGITSVEFAARQAADVWWRRAIVFYFGENPKNAQSLTQVIQSVETTSVTDAFATACTAGLALQACYLSPVVAKLEIWKILAKAIADLKANFIGEQKVLGDTPLLADVMYYLMHRDSLALSNIEDSDADIKNWAEDEDGGSGQLKALVHFAMMRIGRFDLISDDAIGTLRGQMPWQMISLLEIAEVAGGRPLPERQKERAIELGKIASTNAEQMLKELMSEVTLSQAKHKLIQDAIAERTLPEKRASGDPNETM